MNSYAHIAQSQLTILLHINKKKREEKTIFTHIYYVRKIYEKFMNAAMFVKFIYMVFNDFRAITM